MRVALGVAALGVIGLLAVLSPVWDDVSQRGFVTAARTFELRSDGPGEYVWTLESGRSASGQRPIEQHVVEFSRGDQVQMTVAEGLENGSFVTEGQELVVLRSLRNERRMAELLAQRDSVMAQRELLQAGERPEALSEAQRSLDLARAVRDSKRPDLERTRQLAEVGAGSEAALESAELNDQVRQVQVALAKASLRLTSAGARPEQLAMVDGELGALEARLAELEVLLGSSKIISPIDGVVEMGADDTIVRIHDLDSVYVRMPLDETDRYRLTQAMPVRFSAPAAQNQSFDGRIVSFSQQAVQLNGKPVFWVSAEVVNPGLVLRPGMTGKTTFVRGEEGSGVVTNVVDAVSGVFE